MNSGATGNDMPTKPTDDGKKQVKTLEETEEYKTGYDRGYEAGLKIGREQGKDESFLARNAARLKPRGRETPESD